MKFPSALTARSYRKREGISDFTLGRGIREKGTNRENEHQHFVALVVKVGRLYKGSASEGIGLFGTLSDWVCSIKVVHNLIRTRWVRWWLIRRVLMVLCLGLLLWREVVAMYGWDVAK